MSIQALEQEYIKRIEQYSTDAQALGSKYNTYSFVRLLLFIIFLILSSILGVKVHAAVGFILFMLFLIGFYYFVKWHTTIKTEKILHENLATLNRQELAALQHDYSAYSDGKEFEDAQHPYSVDMDIFGAHSVFQYLNRTSTAVGRNALANYLSNETTKEEVYLRQEAIKELNPMLKWRQDLQALGMGIEDELRFSLALQEWLSQESVIYGHGKYKLAMLLVPVISVAGIIASIFWLPWQILFLTFAPAVYFLRQTREAIDKIVHQTESVDKILYTYSRLIQHVENQNFTSTKVNSLTSTLQARGGKNGASDKIKRLSYLISQLNVRNNVFAIIFNLIGLWDIFWANKLEKWKEDQQDDLGQWFDTMGELEVLSSFANLHYNNPEWIFPTIEDNATFEGVQLGHPLLHRSKRICNDFTCPTNGHIKLVTGSNMAGKSTFLRTVGLNIALACIGSPVCAKTMRLPMLRVYSSMRTQDALHESTSSFYAELKRLKFIIEAAEKGENIFFLLDEILKGTNSKDRHTGSKALIKQLINNKGAGIIATHDLELGILESQYGGAIENLCMEVRVENGELFFDYTLDKGVSQSFNATILMQNMGIKISDLG